MLPAALVAAAVVAACAPAVVAAVSPGRPAAVAAVSPATARTHPVLRPEPRPAQLQRPPDQLAGHLSTAVQHAVDVVSEAGGGTGFPALLLGLVALFLLVQGRVDRRDPKLLLTSDGSERQLSFRPPPSREQP